MPLQGIFGISNLLACSMRLRVLGEDAVAMEGVAEEAVSFLRSHFVDKETGRSALPLVRFYVTQRTGELEPELQDFAMAVGTDARSGPDVICLSLLATAGEQPRWNDRRQSVGHKAIPLPSVEAVQRLPMVARLFDQLGVDPAHVVKPDPDLFRDLEGGSYNVFYVPEAVDHPSVPAQADFVIPYGIRSVIGFGGVLPDGVVFAIVAFSEVPIPSVAVDAFAAAALSTKLAVLPFCGRSPFGGHSTTPRSPAAQAELDELLLRSRAQTLDRLLEERAALVDAEATRLEDQLARAEERTAELAASQKALALSEARKAAIVEGALDCVIGMNAEGRITDFNRAAEQTFGHSRQQAVGQLLGDLLVPEAMRERHRLGIAHHVATGEGPILGRRIEVSALHCDGHEFPVELTVTQIAAESDSPLYTGYLRDLTASRRATAELAASHERLAHIARTLQSSLLPPALPAVHGYDLAAAFHAMGDGYEVGGDFYDVFELKDGRWALTLGDVCGKGSEAAAITALARYTIRAAAMRTKSPARVLETVNEAIHRQGPSRFCTAAYAALDPADGSVRLALGGHPQPLLLDSSGEVHAVGTHGQLLGTFPEWRGGVEPVRLEPGDLLMLFSDGVTEARRGDEQFGDERLQALLRSVAGEDATETVRRIEREVLQFAGTLSDDVAILAVRRLF